MKSAPRKIGRSFPLTAGERTVAIQVSVAHLSSTVPAPVNLSVDALHAMWSIYETRFEMPSIRIAWHLGELGRRAQSAPRGQIKTIVPRLLSRGVRMPLLMDAITPWMYV